MKLAEKLINDAHLAKKAQKEAENECRKKCRKLSFSSHTKISSADASFCFKTVKEEDTETNKLMLIADLRLVGDDILTFHEWLGKMIGDSVIETMKEGKNNEE